MRILIDNQKSIEVTGFRSDDEDGQPVIVLGFGDTADLLRAWQELNPGRHGYRWGNEADDNSPCKIITAWVEGDALAIGDVDPFWSPATDTLNAYALGDIAAALPVDAVQWGEDIGEED